METREEQHVTEKADMVLVGASVVKCLLHKAKDLSLMPRTHVYKTSEYTPAGATVAGILCE